jgi:GntR family transcriptional regulator / MocR family aminotransferase
VERSNQGPEDKSNTGTDFLQLDRTVAPPGSLTDWLTAQLRNAIADGRLPVGTGLPGSRVLAAELGVSRGVVTEAYQRLAEEGHVAGYGRAGTRVVAAPISVSGVGLLPRAPEMPPPARSAPGESAVQLAARSAAPFGGVPGTEVFELLRSVPCRIDLSPGVPDLAAFPRSAWLRAERAVLSDLSPASFGYGDPRGTPAFRVAVANWLARNRGIRASPDEVIITAGVAQALALLARVLRQAGVSAVAVEDPGSLGARQQLRSWGLLTPPVPVDDSGLRVSELRASGAAAVMITPAHQFPMGVVLAGSRRRELRQWALEGGLIIEDDYDAEHRYDRPPVPALRAELPEHVCYAGSVSKLLAPALRVGWLLVPADHRDAIVAAKRDADLGNAVLPQLVLAELMASGELERHHRLLRKRHVRRRDAMIEAVSEHLPEARVHGAAAGLHLTLTFDDSSRDRTADAGLTDTGPSETGLSETGLSETGLAVAALERGLKTQPLSWHSQRPCQPGLVLGYAASAPAAIHEGISVIASIVHAR